MITLASDFGSPYPAAMKGVIRRRSAAELVDVSHDLPRGDPRAAAFWLRFVLPEFPPAVHCAVVDPGVGTDRAAIVVRAGDHVVVAPDNGLALPPARALVENSGSGSDGAGSGSDGAESGSDDSMSGIDVFEVRVDDPESATFHGRDVFAPAAAAVHEAAGVDGPPVSPSTLSAIPILSPTDEYVDRTFPDPAVTRDADGELRAVTGEVLVVDDFGNAVTNVPGALVHGHDRVSVDGDPTPIVRTFADVPPGERLVTVGSHGYVECDVNDGHGASAFGLAPGDAVRFSFDG